MSKYRVRVKGSDFYYLELDAESEQDAVEQAATWEASNSESFYNELQSEDLFEYDLGSMSAEVVECEWALSGFRTGHCGQVRVERCYKCGEQREVGLCPTDQEVA